jgi:hypothetical protein
MKGISQDFYGSKRTGKSPKSNGYVRHDPMLSTLGAPQ